MPPGMSPSAATPLAFVHRKASQPSIPRTAEPTTTCPSGEILSASLYWLPALRAPSRKKCAARALMAGELRHPTTMQAIIRRFMISLPTHKHNKAGYGHASTVGDYRKPTRREQYCLLAELSLRQLAFDELLL